jgi:microcystin-dependent protein
MSDPFVAEVRIFAGNFAPTGWAMCNGQVLPISQNAALYSLLGNIYGGDENASTFALPNLQGSVVIGAGQGPGGLSSYFPGETGGEQTVTLLQSQIPAHTHNLACVSSNATTGTPSDTVLLASGKAPEAYVAPGPATLQLNPTAIGPAGGSQPHDNMQPYLTLMYIIAMQGIFPSRQ